VVCTIEAGGLEDMTVRMVRSLRRWGGPLADAPVLAVTPRRGPGLKRSTRDALRAAGVERRILPRANPFPWYSMFNKIATAVEAERTAASDTLVWLDSDVLVCGPLDGLVLPEELDFTARSDRNLAVTETDRTTEPYWRAVCDAIVLPFESIPWIPVPRDTGRMRLGWNGGVFAWRRDRGFARAWDANCRAVMDRRIASATAGFWLTEQLLVGLTMLKLNLRWRELPRAFNFSVTRHVMDSPEGIAALPDARLIHYHDSMWKAGFPRFVSVLKQHRPELHAWVAPQGPLNADTGLLTRARIGLVRRWRNRRLKSFESTCHKP
jgi:hypothetical protein